MSENSYLFPHGNTTTATTPFFTPKIGGTIKIKGVKYIIVDFDLGNHKLVVTEYSLINRIKYFFVRLLRKLK